MGSGLWLGDGCIMIEKFEDENIGAVWTKTGGFVICEGPELLPDKVWLTNGWNLERVEGNMYKFIDQELPVVMMYTPRYLG